MSIDYNQHFTDSVSRFLNSEFQVTVASFEFQQTRKEFEGDITLLVFPLLRYIKTNPEKLAETIGSYLEKNDKAVVGYNVVKGFLNLSLSDAFYLKQFQTLFQQEEYGHQPQKKDGPTLMVEFSSPNTNKPLHLGHIRNNILGYSVSKILEANGNRVVKTQIINDRGIHICKSMLAWKKFGAGKTPELTGIKGDQLVGKYYVIFDAEYKNFDLSLLFQGSTGGIASIRVGEFGDIGNYYKWQHDNRWSIDNPSRVHPRLASRSDTYYTNNYGNNTYYFAPTNYLRLKNIELGYNLPKELLGENYFSNVRIYANGLNILTFTKYDNIFDPEVAGRGYPLSRVFNFGVRASF